MKHKYRRRAAGTLATDSLNASSPKQIASGEDRSLFLRGRTGVCNPTDVCIKPLLESYCCVSVDVSPL